MSVYESEISSFTWSEEQVYRNPKSHMLHNAHLQVTDYMQNKAVAQFFKATSMSSLI